jgi:hypothetical protein
VSRFQCAAPEACKCASPWTPKEDVCGDGKDDDCDKLVDCADEDCTLASQCAQCVPEGCTNGIDDDCDGRIDCADPDCSAEVACTPVAEVCNSKLDEDRDGRTDCADPDCRTAPYCALRHSTCPTAALISQSGTYTGDTTGFQGLTTGTCGGESSESVFYFVLGHPSHVVLDTIGTRFDSTVYVRGNPCETGPEIACDDDMGGNWAAKLDLPLLAPGTYYVFVDGRGGTGGPYVLNVTLDPS